MKDLYSDSHDVVAKCIKSIIHDNNSYITEWSRDAQVYINYANGDQSSQYEAINKSLDDIGLISTNSDNFGYTTNEIAPVIRTLVSFLTRSKPTIDAVSVGTTAEDKNVAYLSQKFIEAKYDLDGEYDKTRTAVEWALVLGHVFSKDYWNSSAGFYVNKVDENGAQIYDEEGNPELELSGNNEAKILTPMSMILDYSTMDFDKMPYVGDSAIIDVDYARKLFAQDKENFTGFAEKIVEDVYADTTVDLFEQMKLALPYRGSFHAPIKKNKCQITEFFIAPNLVYGYPQGRQAIFCGGQLVFLTKKNNPYFMPSEPLMWHPYCDYKYETYIGRFLGKGLVQDILALNIRINEINKAIMHNAGTLAKPNLFAAEGQMRKGITKGGGGNIWTYKQIPGAPPPFAFNGVPLPSQFFNELNSLREQIVKIVGTNFVMNGGIPSGVTAASAINQLIENSNSQHSTASIALERFEEQRFNKKLRIFKKFNEFPDQQLNTKLKEIASGSLSTQRKDFIGTMDLSDGIHIQLQKGSMLPKSESIIIETYKEAAKSGAFGPGFIEDSPRGERLRNLFFKKIKLDPFETEQNSDIKKAKWENDKIRQNNFEVMVGEFDQHQFHLAEHVAEFQDPAFTENSTEEQIRFLYQHIKEHQAQEQQQNQEKQMAEMQAQQQQQMMNQPPMPEQQGPPPPML